jgi:L-lactate dehydrogenase complex protein LldF
MGLSNQRGALLHTTAVLAAQRRAAVAAQPDWAELTARCTALRRHTIAHLGVYLDQLERAIQARGGQVIWARNSGEACQAIIALAQRAGVTQVVQTRSVLPLEIGLTAALQGAGLTTFLLNQGEFLAELSGQRPAHPNAGVANLRIDDIVRTLHARLDMPVFLNADAANRIIRGRTRQAVLQSALAVMGIDFAVAETGALALFNDQGDVRLASALAPLQVGIMGLEQIAPTFDDLWLLSGVQTRSASGRSAPTYVELLSGAPTADREFHLILLDNGRSAMLAQPEADLLTCIQCGACVDVCPVARRVGSQPYAWSYPGPVGAVMGPLHLSSQFADAAEASTLCGACRTVCPVGIDLPRHLLRARARRPGSRVRPSGWVSRTLLSSHQAPGARLLMLSAVNRLGRLLVRGGRSRRWLAPWLWRWTAARHLPPPAAETFRARWARQHSPESGGAAHA